MFTRIFWTDGACSQNGTWAGGYGVVELSHDLSQTMNEYIDRYSINFHKSGTCEKTTNNRMELTAMLEALKQIDKYIESNEQDTKYIIYTDSAYVQNSCCSWIYTWAKNSWQNSKKVIVENVDLMKEIYKYLTKNFNNCQISILKVKGHNNELGNELADALATSNRKKWKELILKFDIAYNDICYCPICDKDVETTIHSRIGHCPKCGHHLNSEDK